MNLATQRIIARYIFYWYKLRPIRKNNCGGKAILVLRPDAIGDLVCTIPFLRSLRKDFPDHIITLVVAPSIYNMMELCPYVDEIITFDKKAAKHKFMTTLKRSIKFVKEKLPQHYYEYTFVPASYATTDLYSEAWISYLSHAKYRIAWSECILSKNHHDYAGTYDMYFTNLCKDIEVHHEVEGCLGLLRFINKPVGNTNLELWTNNDDVRVANRLLENGGVNPLKFKVIVNLSTSNTTKDWPVENFIEVCRHLYEKYEVQFLLIGAGETACKYAKEFCRSITKAYNFVNQTTIRQMIEIIRRSDFYLGGDTGPMHLAAACGLGGVAIYKTAKTYKGISPAVWFAPWQSKIKVLQPEKPLPGCENDCTKPSHCIRLIEPGQVYTEMSKQIQLKQRQ